MGIKPDDSEVDFVYEKSTNEAIVEAQKIESVINGCYGEQLIGEAMAHYTHRTLQQKFMRLIIAFMVAQARKSPTDCDLRNQATVELCKKLLKNTDLKYDLFLPFY